MAQPPNQKATPSSCFSHESILELLPPNLPNRMRMEKQMINFEIIKHKLTLSILCHSQS